MNTIHSCGPGPLTMETWEKTSVQVGRHGGEHGIKTMTYYCENNRPTSSNPRTRNTLQVNGQRGVICSNACRNVHEGPWFGVFLLPEEGSTNKWRCFSKSPSSNLTTFIHLSKCSFSSPLWFALRHNFYYSTWALSAFVLCSRLIKYELGLLR